MDGVGEQVLVGWRVLDPDGNVVQAGPWPAAELTAVSEAGDTAVEEEE